jgi:hypothetical protein
MEEYFNCIIYSYFRDQGPVIRNHHRQMTISYRNSSNSEGRSHRQNFLGSRWQTEPINSSLVSVSDFFPPASADSLVPDGRQPFARPRQLSIELPAGSPPLIALACITSDSFRERPTSSPFNSIDAQLRTRLLNLFPFVLSRRNPLAGLLRSDRPQ